MRKTIAKNTVSAPTINSTTTNTTTTALTVTTLNNQIKDYLNVNYRNKDIEVVGEVSNYKTYGLNTIYFTLKDNTSSISCCIWDANTFKFKNGDQVTVSGRIITYVKTGTYQLNVKNISVSGSIGNLYESFERLKLYYKNLGYFDRPKKHLHPYIDNICVVTAQGGAALQDFLSVLNKSNYTGNVTIKNVVVQGNECPKSVSAALALVNQMDFDIIVVTRGGGSYEDLCGFNSAEIVEELYKSKTITISAIGHEIDTVLTDYVADIRAATPTMAANMITSNLINKGYYYDLLNSSLQTARDVLNKYKNIILNARLNAPSDDVLLTKYIATINKLKGQSCMHIEKVLAGYRNQLMEMRTMFAEVNIKNVLNEYVIIVDKNGERVTNKKTYKKNVKNKIKMKIIFVDGNVII